MSPTLLLDLDNTLLTNDIEAFLPQYLQLFGKEVAATIDADKFVKALMAGTRRMMRNQRPDCTLKEVFDETFFPAIGPIQADFQALADQFYKQVYPALQPLTSPRPQAIALVQTALQQGYKLVVATNPLFPASAILQRLAWADLPVEQYPFEIVTSYESFHFTKPNPAYFAELLARIGWPEGPILVVGDDLENDIHAAQQMGLPTFWLPQNGQTTAQDQIEGHAVPLGSGGLEDVLPWLKKAHPETLLPNYNLHSAMQAVLRATPAALDSLCRSVDRELWTQRPQINAWCLTEILCHLRDVDEQVNLPRLQRVLQELNPFISGKDTDPWAEERQYIRQDGAQALRQFIQTRLKLLDLVESLTPEDWQRPARHAIFGRTDLAELVNFITGHDRLHIQQVHAVLQAITH